MIVSELKRIIKAFGYSFDGFVAAFKSEAAFRWEILIFIIGTIIAIILPVSLLAKAILISSLIMILLAELVNTAIETIVNRISKDIHPMSKKAKDIGSLLVLLSFINAAVVWCAILLHHF